MSLSFMLCLFRQQVPEHILKNKKKTKWRGDRAMSSHKLHCVILWYWVSSVEIISVWQDEMAERTD